MTPTQTLIYAYDPMCSWCYGFKPVLHTLTESLKHSHNIKYVLGGLAADSNELMPLSMQDQIKSNWERIENTIPGTKFNYDFWDECQPRRSTYPACRAVIAAKHQHNEHKMIEAIQDAYYLNKKNPSDYSTLYQLAEQLKLNMSHFKQDIHSETIELELKQQIDFCKKIGADSFPSLFLLENKNNHHIVIDYNNVDTIIEHVKSFE